MIGLVLGGTLVGTLVGAAGTVFTLLLPDWLGWGAVLAFAAVVMAFELVGRPLRLPQNGRAVPQDIITRQGIEGPLQFGFEMGTGLRTFMPSSVPHVLALSVLLVGGLGPGVAAGLGFGLGRVLMPALRARYRTPNDWDLLLVQRARLHYALGGLAFSLVLAAMLVGA
jgi:hypothetical protein